MTIFSINVQICDSFHIFSGTEYCMYVGTYRWMVMKPSTPALFTLRQDLTRLPRFLPPHSAVFTVFFFLLFYFVFVICL